MVSGLDCSLSHYSIRRDGERGKQNRGMGRRFGLPKISGEVFLVPLDFWQLAFKMLTSKNESTREKKLFGTDNVGVSPDDDDYLNVTSC